MLAVEAGGSLTKVGEIWVHTGVFDNLSYSPTHSMSYDDYRLLMIYR